MLLVMEWLETVPLTDLLADLAAADSPADGPVLVARLCREAGATPEEMLDRAARRGRRLAAPAYSRR